MSVPPEQVQSVSEALSYWAKATPEAIAFLSPGRAPVTYRELAEAVGRLAGELRARGLGRQDGIALLLPEGPEFCLALLAALSVGIAVPLVWPAPEAEYHSTLANPRVSAVVISTAVEPPALERADEGLLIISLSGGGSGQVEGVHIDGKRIGPPRPETWPAADDIALVLHSSGTTGRPKLVPRLQRGIVSTCRIFIEGRGITSVDRCLSLAKMAYTQGVTTLTTAIFAGASLVILPGQDQAALARWFTAYRPTYLSTTPAVLRAMAADRGELRDALRHSPLRCIHSSAGPLSTKEVCGLEATLGAPILNSYGMSEASFIAGERYAGYQRVPGAVGIPWGEVQIVAERGVPVGLGTTGEIEVRGPRVFPGYLDDREANAAAFLPGGWFRTGDVGFLDDGEYLHLTGRISEIINRGGANIAPVEIDRALVNHPAVADGAVFAVPDRRLGEDIIAAVVLEPGSRATSRELRVWMLDRLSPYKVPRRIWVVKNLPRTATGKVQRGELARRWADNRG
jgi:acyl-CoA synthetase (AMP-forming)/AMP-acid ligase II